MISTVAGRQTLPGTCGAGLLYGFQLRAEGPQSGYNRSFNPDLATASPVGGAGWTCAGFVKEARCKEAYEVLKKKYKIVIQTPVRTNSNSGRKFFFMVYDTKKPRWVGKSKGAPQPEYDLSGNAAHSWPFK